eukprot:CAMPEP_0174731308 /NCGR_PEP_ID=MMETSP1094-20130205/57275_1 /TAXON_ID=156173 /ORGANISM="Chrysochromulina brevifilum, Strain UTEX LB 985" /LENGTH=59 /DNA_ID=CAMNT_0015933671 /DNA_START=62 /DNA_END=238 /DNA_ORIENTATION=-
MNVWRDAVALGVCAVLCHMAIVTVIQPSLAPSSASSGRFATARDARGDDNAQLHRIEML